MGNPLANVCITSVSAGGVHTALLRCGQWVARSTGFLQIRVRSSEGCVSGPVFPVLPSWPRGGFRKAHGEMKIEFFEAEDLFRQLFEIAQVIRNNYEKFGKVVEG